MNILSEAKSLLSSLKIPIETGVFKGEAPSEYIVLTPLSDSFPLNADDKPQADEQELRVTLYSKNNYIKRKNEIVRLLIGAFFVITDRSYGGYDTVAGYHQYTIDIAKNYEMEDLN